MNTTTPSHTLKWILPQQSSIVCCYGNTHHFLYCCTRSNHTFTPCSLLHCTCEYTHPPHGELLATLPTFVSMHTIQEASLGQGATGLWVWQCKSWFKLAAICQVAGRREAIRAGCQSVCNYCIHYQHKPELLPDIYKHERHMDMCATVLPALIMCMLGWKAQCFVAYPNSKTGSNLHMTMSEKG